VGEIVGIVLGAGSSKRLGRPKQTLPFGDRTLLDHVVGDAEASALDRVVVVLGDDAATAATSLHPVRAEVACTHAYSTGCAASLLAGLDAAGDAEAVTLLLGDMPGVTPDIIDPVLAVWRRRPTWAAVTAYANGIGHPLVFASDAFPTLRSLHGDKAVWKLVDGAPVERVARIVVDGPLPLDIDTHADYMRVCEQFGYAPAAADPSPQV